MTTNKTNQKINNMITVVDQANAYVYDTNKVKNVVKVVEGIDDKLKAKLYKTVQGLAGEYITAIEKSEAIRKEISKHEEVARKHNKKLEKELDKLREEKSSITAVNELKIIGALSQSRVTEVEIIEVEGTSYTLYNIHGNGVWTKVEDICLDIDNKEERAERIADVTKLIKATVEKQKKRAEIQEKIQEKWEKERMKSESEELENALEETRKELNKIRDELERIQESSARKLLKGAYEKFVVGSYHSLQHIDYAKTIVETAIGENLDEEALKVFRVLHG